MTGDQQQQLAEWRARLGQRVESVWFENGRLHARNAGEVLVDVAGGTLDVGLTRADEVSFSQLASWTAGVSARMAALRARGTQRVCVKPFLCGKMVVRGSTLRSRLALPYDQAVAEAERRGLRLLDEAEYEWLARGGAAVSSWARREYCTVEELDQPQWAKRVLVPPGNAGAAQGVVCGGMSDFDPQSPEERVGELAACRLQLDRAYFRVALTLPTN